MRSVVWNEKMRTGIAWPYEFRGRAQANIEHITCITSERKDCDRMLNDYLAVSVLEGLSCIKMR
jgi:hypothetical protein